MKHPYKFNNRLRLLWLLCCSLGLVALPTHRLLAHVAEGPDFPDCSITLHVANQEVKNVLAKIQQQCDVRFTYSSTVIPVTRKVSLSVTNRRLDQVLNEFLPTCDIDYRIEDRQVILFKAAEKSGFSTGELVPILAPAIELRSITGRVTDANGDGRLSFSEARAQLNGLTRAQFDAMDTNQDGLLSRAELGDVVPPPPGCPAGKSALPQLGDLFLLGVALLALAGVRGRMGW